VSEHVAIVGSRPAHDSRGRMTPETLRRHQAVRAYVRALPADVVVISGGALGVDTVAVEEARARGLAHQVYRADWQAFGKRAGAIRNRRIAEEADRVVCFWEGVSPGTAITLSIARELGKPVEVIRP
jgi:predicted Rossmann fold nucleotide-binding protein DprA/Smf involved in DNA uptake